MFNISQTLEMAENGGVAMYILIGCSILSLSIILERLIYYWRLKGVARNVFMAALKKTMDSGDTTAALLLCDEVSTPFAHVAAAGLRSSGRDAAAAAETMNREIALQSMSLERYTGIVGTIGSIAVYIGLFGTVLGIVRAFKDIASSSEGGINVVIGGISEALICTAAGLLVAIPAVVAYNYFMKRIDGFIADMELCASETAELVRTKRK